MASEFSKTAVVVWPVASETVEDAHVTVVFLGEVVEVAGAYGRALQALKEADLSTPGEIPVTGYEVFGEEKKVWVALLDPEALSAEQARLEGSLRRNGLDNASSFSDYRPHVTIAPYESDDQEFERLASYTLLSPQLWWGEHKVRKYIWEMA